MKRYLVQLTVFALIVSCGNTGPEPRYAAVSNTLSVMGYVQTDTLVEGSLPEGQTIEFNAQFDAGNCYAVLALGMDGIEEISVTIFDGEQERGRDLTNDSQAAARVCPTRTGEHRVTVTAERGGGSYMVSSWLGADSQASGSMSTPTNTGITGSGEGTCDAPFILTEAGASGTTSPNQGSHHTAPCTGDTAPEHVYRFDATNEGSYTFYLNSDFDGTLTVYQGNCGGTVLGCNDDDQDTSTSRVDADLQPGTYFVVVDGYGESAGSYTLSVTRRQTIPPAQACAQARVISPGVTTGDTSQRTDSFQSTCANNSPGPDEVFSLQVNSPSRLRAQSSQMGFDGSLYMRTTCDAFTSEIACNDDYMSANASAISALVQPGTYYLFVDGYSSSGGGPHTLQVDLAPTAGGGAPSDSCGSAQTITAGLVSGDTFQAADDYAGSCGGQGNGDVVYEINLQDASTVTAQIMHASFNPVLYFQSRCGNAGSEQACAQGRQISANLPRGRHYLVVDGQTQNDFGAFEIQLEVRSSAAARNACRGAQRIRPGQTVRGNTSGGSDNFQASCAGGARSPEVVYSLRVPRRMDVQVDSTTNNYDGALFMRSDCMNEQAEIACDDDFQSTSASRIVATVDPGTYYIYIDGFNQNNSGDYELTVTTGAPGTLARQAPTGPPPSVMPRPTPMPQPMPPRPTP